MFLEQVLKLIQENNITKNKLLVDLKLSKNSFIDWQKRGSVPSAETVKKIADYFNVTVDYLLTGTDSYPSEDITFFEVIGSVKAGYDGQAFEEHTGETTPIPTFFLKGLKKDEFFVLRVSGNSMYPKMLDGDLVLVQRTPSVDSGAIAVVLYDNDEATIKQVKYVTGEDWFELIPANPEYEVKRIEGPDIENCRILGRVVKLIRDV